MGTDDLAASVRSLTDGEGVDLILEHVAGPVLAQAISAVRKRGTVVQMGRLGGPDATIDVDALSFGRVTVVGVSFGEADELAELLATARQELLPAVAAGAVRPVIHSAIPFTESDKAIETIRTYQAVRQSGSRTPLTAAPARPAPRYASQTHNAASRACSKSPYILERCPAR